MTGIERLRRVAEAQDMRNVWTAMLSHELSDIADQIERERACDADTIENIRLIVGVVIDDMERHILGHEGMEDSPVARWARELRGALKSDASDEREVQNPSWHDPANAADVTSDAPKVTRDPAEDVGMSAYDLLPADERDAIAWVRDHGGLDYVKAEWRSRVPRDLTRENAELRKRAMPEGCQWPRYESGESVGFGDDVSRHGGDFEVNVIALYRDGSFALNFRAYSKGERVRRPAVPASDGEPLEVGQTVWDENGDELVVGALEDGGHTVTCRYADVGDGIPVHGIWSPSDLTHQRPVLDADGVPIKVGEHVWDDHGEELVVLGLSGGLVRCRFSGEACIDSVDDDRWEPSQLTHEPPDSWERIEEDAGCTAAKYNERRGTIFTTKQQVARDLVRRAKALAERERGE